MPSLALDTIKLIHCPLGWQETRRALWVLWWRHRSTSGEEATD
eukprot:COSAG02_NODE_2051_length_10000_cov_2.340471_7_plen_43_part_00